jgi:molecular chaperone DnaK
VFDVVGTGGDTYLGGEDFDHRIVEWLVMNFAKEHGFDLRKDRMALQRLKDAAEKAKIELSSTKEAQINLPFISSPPGGGQAMHLQAVLTRAKLEELTDDLAKRVQQIAEKVLAEAKVRPADLKEVILVGGMTRMPRIVELVKAYFRREPCKGVHPDEVVALGAAIQAQALTTPESSVLLLDVTPQSLGVAIAGGYCRKLIPRNTTVPTSVSELFNTSRDNQTTVKIMVLQGESEIAYENELLGEFVLTGLREAARGKVEIEVTFEINSEGIVSVLAKDKETGKRQTLTVTASGGLTEQELKRIMDEQRDYLLEARVGEELKAKRAELEVAVQQLQQLLPKVRAHLGPTSSGVDPLRKPESDLATAQSVLKSDSLADVVDWIERLGHTAGTLYSVLQRKGPPGA